MKRVLCVRLPNWPIQRLSRELHPDIPAAFAIHSSATMDSESLRNASDDVARDYRFVRTLFPTARSGPAIISASSSAWNRGVRPGLPLAEARSMARPLSQNRKSWESEVAFFEWEPAAERQRLIRLAESLRRFAPVVGIDAMPLPDCLLLDVTGCGILFGSESMLAEELLSEVHAHGFDARICISDSVASSWAFTHADGSSAKSSGASPTSEDELQRLPILVIPPGQQIDHAGPLSVSTMRLTPADCALLSQLGIRRIGQLLRLPREDLPSRISTDALLRIRQFQSLEEEQIIPLPEADPVTAEWNSESPVSDESGLRQVIEHLTEGIVVQLVRRRAGCIRLECELLAEDSDPTVLEAHLLKPEQTASLLCEVLSLKLESLPQTTALHRVRLTATLAPLPPVRQKDLFSATEHIEPQEELAGLINRLSNRLGSDSVLVARPNPDPRPEQEIRHRPILGHDAASSLSAADKTLRALVQPEEASDGVPRMTARPLQLLPVPAAIPGSADLANLTDHSFEWNGHRHQVRKLQGPERIQTAWWCETPVHRDYFVATTAADSRFWLFRERRTGTWYVHGIFE